MKLHREVLPARERVDPRTLEQQRREIQRGRVITRFAIAAALGLVVPQIVLWIAGAR